MRTERGRTSPLTHHAAGVGLAVRADDADWLGVRCPKWDSFPLPRDDHPPDPGDLRDLAGRHARKIRDQAREIEPDSTELGRDKVACGHAGMETADVAEIGPVEPDRPGRLDTLTENGDLVVEPSLVVVRFAGRGRGAHGPATPPRPLTPP